MVRSLRAALVAMAVLSAAVAAAQPVPPVRLSVRTDGTQVLHPSTLVAVSDDGRHVLFRSAGDFVPGDLNGHPDLYVRDRDTDADGVFDEPDAVRTLLMTVGPEGQQLGPMPPDIGTFTGGGLSASGRFVHFTTGWALVAQDTNDVADGYLYDRDIDADGLFDEPGAAGLSLVTTGSGNALATGGASTVLQISADGRYVLFRSLATNLQPRPTTVAQIYRKDRVTSLTTLVSGTPDGTPADMAIAGAMATADGRSVAFAGGFAASVDGWVLRDLTLDTFRPITAPALQSAFPKAPDGVVGFSADGSHLLVSRNWRYVVGSIGVYGGTIYDVDVTSGRVVQQFDGVDDAVYAPRIGGGGAHGVSLDYSEQAALGPCGVEQKGRFRYDQRTGRVRALTSGWARFSTASGDGRRLVYEQRAGCANPITGAPGAYLWDATYDVSLPMPAAVGAGALDAAGGTAFFESADPTILGSADTNGVADVFAVDLLSRLDRDGDSLDDRWEAAMGLDYSSAAGINGAAGDPDTDGATNAQEFAASTHPLGAARQFLAEGADNVFFKTRLAIANPGATAATAVVRLDGDDGTARSVNVHVPAGASRTVFVDEIAGHAPSFATVIDSTVPLVAERTMSWDATEYGAHAERASGAPSTSWFLAEGATGAFSLFYLLQNPGEAAATATVRYLRPSPLAPIERSYTLAPHSRTTLPVNTQAPELADTDVSASIMATQPIFVERSMYRTVGSQVFAAGHASAGVTAAATNWFLAEGATGAFFDMFLLIANPTPTDATVEVRYLLTDGTVLTKTYTVAAESRRTIYVDGETFPGLGQALVNATLSAAITSTNAVPIVVERSMWFPGPAVTPTFWTEAHNSSGTTTTATRWVLADGESGGTRAAQTFVLIANTSSTAGRVRLTQLLDTPGPIDGAAVPTVTVDVPANSRTTVPLHDTTGFAGKRFGVLVESIDTAPLAQIVVERAMYWNAGGEIWAAGTNLLATPVP